MRASLLMTSEGELVLRSLFFTIRRFKRSERRRLVLTLKYQRIKSFFNVKILIDRTVIVFIFLYTMANTFKKKLNYDTIKICKIISSVHNVERVSIEVESG